MVVTMNGSEGGGSLRETSALSFAMLCNAMKRAHQYADQQGPLLLIVEAVLCNCVACVLAAAS
jgi:hypothetical protein